jgi:hypothetical protein
MSTYHLSIVLYEYLKEKNFIPLDNININDILVKYYVYSYLNNKSQDYMLKNNEVVSQIISNSSQLKNTIETQNFLHDFLIENNFTKSKEFFCLIHKKDSNNQANLAEIIFNLIENEVNTENISKLIEIAAIFEASFQCDKIRRCFKRVVKRINEQSFNTREEIFKKIYLSLFASQRLFELFIKTQYECECETISNYDSNYRILATIKYFDNNKNYLWKHLFLYCFYEKKILIQSFIVSCVYKIGYKVYKGIFFCH